MHRNRPALLLSALPLILSATHALAASDNGAGACNGLSANLLRDMRAGHFVAATAHLDAKVKSLLSAQKLRQIWQQTLPSQLGNFQTTSIPQEVDRNGRQIVITPLNFANGWLNMLVACNGHQQIAGLFFRPGQTPADATQSTPAAATAWIVRAATGAKTLPISIPRKGFALKGVLDLPPGTGPFGVVDIIPGSGPVDLNGNDGPIQYSPYKKLAAALVKAGWAVARVAKRGMSPSDGDGNDITFANQVADNRAIIRALRKNPRINPQEIVVAGHSIGGLIAPRVAAETPLAGMILLEAPGESMTKITTSQVLAMNPRASATQRAAIIREQAGFYQTVAQTPHGKPLTYNGKIIPAWEVRLLKSWYAQKPLAMAHKVTIPVLVVQGGKDFNVAPGNGKRLVRTLPHGKLLYLKNMGHALDDASCRCAKQLDTGKEADLAPGLTAGIVRWLHAL